MRAILIFVYSVCYLNGNSQINWAKTTDWKLYRVQGHGLFRLSIDSLNSFENLLLDVDSMRQYLTDCKQLHPDGPLAWMGGYVVTYNLEGSTRKIEVSSYGGFVYDEKSRNYYQVSTDLKESWELFFSNEYHQLARSQSSR